MLGPAVNSLRPFARKLKPVNDSLGSLAKTTFDPVKQEIRPFVINARQPVRDLRPAAREPGPCDPPPDHRRLEAQRALQHGRLQPQRRRVSRTPGRDEGYLYWLGWLAHVGNSTFSSQDAHGVYRHVYLMATCNTIKSILATSPLAPAVTGLGQLLGTVCPP